MEPFEYLRLLRRRRLLIVLATVAGLALGFVTAPSGAREQAPTYGATHTLIIDPQASAGVNLDQAAVLVTLGEVPRLAATALGEEGASGLTSQISASANREVGTLSISARSEDPARAEALADAFASALVRSLGGENTTTYQQLLSQQLEQSNLLQQRITDLQVQLADGGIDLEVGQAELDALANQYRQSLEIVEQLQSQGAPASPLRTLEPASASVTNEAGFSAPQSRPGRMALLGAVGLALGVVLAVAVERVDRRLRTKQSVEQAFGVPVIAEIPVLPRNQRQELLTETRPTSPFVEAYRGLRTVVLLMQGLPGAAVRPSAQTADDADPDHAKHLAVLITSSGADEGKTTSVAHLASLFAETGRSVLVLSADFRRPRLHLLFGVDDKPGLTDVLAGGPDAPKLSEVVRSTGVPGVSLVTSGSAVDNPSQLLAAARNVVRAAKQHVDVVLIDTAPLLVAGDAVDLMAAADAVVVLARWGQTTTEAARRAGEALALVEAPLLGAVLIGAPEGEAAYSYYHYYNRTDRKGRRRKVRTEAPEATDEPLLHARPGARTSTDWRVLDEIDLHLGPGDATHQTDPAVPTSPEAVVGSRPEAPGLSATPARTAPAPSPPVTRRAERAPRWRR